MYLHLGMDKVITFDDIIGIFDLDTTTVSKNTRDFLAKAEKAGIVENVCYDLPKSFIVCKTADGENTVTQKLAFGAGNPAEKNGFC